MKTITFYRDKHLNPLKFAASANIVLVGSVRRLPFAYVLVDSGADYVQLPLYAATHAGINMSNSRSVLVSGVGGTMSMFLLSNVTVEIESKSVQIDVLFDPSQGRPLLGRNGLRALGDEYGFDVADWLWNT